MAKKKMKGNENGSAKKNIMPVQGELEFDYIKSNFFRVIKVDGIHGGIVPNGRAIQIAFFSERQPIPQKEKYRFEGGQLKERISRQGRDAVVREVEVEAILDLDAAISFRKWLDDKITLLMDVQGRKE